MVFFSGEIDKFWNKKIWHAKLGLRTGEHFSCVLMTSRHRLYWQYPQWRRRRRRRRKVSVSSDKSSWSLVSSRPSHSLRGSRSIHPPSQISWSQVTNSVWSEILSVNHSPIITLQPWAVNSGLYGSSTIATNSYLVYLLLNFNEFLWLEVDNHRVKRTGATLSMGAYRPCDGVRAGAVLGVRGIISLLISFDSPGENQFACWDDLFGLQSSVWAEREREMD